MSNTITTEPVVATPAQVVEAPTVTEQVTETPSTTEPVEELKVTESSREVAAAPAVPTTTEEAVTEAPHPTTSKSNTTKRLSIFLGKAKTYVDKKVHEKKPTSPKKEVAEIPEPIVETAVEEPSVEEPAVQQQVEAKVPKTEKRKSILAGIFRSKSPVHKESEATTTSEVAKPDETAPVQEVQETPVVVDTAAVDAAASATGVVEEESTAIVEQHAEKENVIDQIKRSPLGKFFNKKKEAEHKEEVVAEVAATPAVEEPQVVTAVIEEPVVEAPAQPEEKPVSRPGSPLGRRITQMFRGFSSKKKVPTVEDVAAKKEEETPQAVVEAPQAETVAAIAAPVEHTATETHQHEEHATVVPPSAPTLQSSA